MYSLILMACLVSGCVQAQPECSEPKLLGTWNNPLTVKEQEMINRAKFVCSFRYRGCAKTLERKKLSPEDKSYHYNVICAKE